MVNVGLALFAVALELPRCCSCPSRPGTGWGSKTGTGVCAGFIGLAMMPAASLAARLSAGRGPEVALMTGLGLLDVWYLVGMARLRAMWQIVLVAVLAGCGVGTAYAAMPRSSSAPSTLRNRVGLLVAGPPGCSQRMLSPDLRAATQVRRRPGGSWPEAIPVVALRRIGAAVLTPMPGIEARTLARGTNRGGAWIVYQPSRHNSRTIRMLSRFEEALLCLTH